MRLGNRTNFGRSIETLVIPRPNGEDIVFKAQGILDFQEFEKLCPEPKPKMILSRTEGKIPNFNDPTYKLQLEQREKKRMAYIVIKSLEATEDLIWDRVNINNPDTWLQWEDELKEAGLSDFERKRIFTLTMNANSLNEAKMDEARKAFLAMQEDQSRRLSSQVDEPNSTQNGELVNDSASDPQASVNAGTT